MDLLKLQGISHEIRNLFSCAVKAHEGEIQRLLWEKLSALVNVINHVNPDDSQRLIKISDFSELDILVDALQVPHVAAHYEFIKICISLVSFQYALPKTFF